MSPRPPREPEPPRPLPLLPARAPGVTTSDRATDDSALGPETTGALPDDSEPAPRPPEANAAPADAAPEPLLPLPRCCPRPLASALPALTLVTATSLTSSARAAMLARLAASLPPSARFRSDKDACDGGSHTPCACRFFSVQCFEQKPSWFGGPEHCAKTGLALSWTHTLARHFP